MNSECYRVAYDIYVVFWKVFLSYSICTSKTEYWDEPLTQEYYSALFILLQWDTLIDYTARSVHYKYFRLSLHCVTLHRRHRLFIYLHSAFRNYKTKYCVVNGRGIEYLWTQRFVESISASLFYGSENFALYFKQQLS